MTSSSLADYGELNRPQFRSWSRHSNHESPRKVKDIYTTSYQTSFNPRTIGYRPDKVIVDYFTGHRKFIPTRQSRNNERFRTPFNDRARKGFRYWLTETKNKTPHCKYSHNWKIWNRGLQECPWHW